MDILLYTTLMLTVLFIVTALTALILRVPYVPTKKKTMNKILNEARLKKGEIFIDLGCGDGRLLIEAEKRNQVTAVGYEIAPLIYLFALSRKIIYRSKAKIKFKNFFKENLNNADVIFCYLMPHELKKLAVKLKKECRKGTKIISNSFRIQGFKPVKVIKHDKKEKTPALYFYQI